MARIKERTISWGASDAPDVAGYRVYWKQMEAPGDQVDYGSSFQDVGNVLSITLPTDIPESLEWDGEYSIGVTAFDHTGNESSMSYGSAFFDFVAPPAPGPVVIF